MRRRLIVATGAVALGAAAAGCGSSSGSSSAGVPNSVSIVNFSFSPQTITVKVGTAVTWANQDSTGHTAASDMSSAFQFDTKTINQGQSAPVTFAQAGTFTYHCGIHNYMTGTVTVTS